ncbi:glycosyl transferase family 2, partial [Escherichia coli]|nr:glycosyl transferase family 2 [Escherichia coli]
GYNVYSAGKHNFVAIRRKNSSNHTWIISDKKILAHSRKIPPVKDYEKFVQKKPKGAL